MTVNRTVVLPEDQYELFREVFLMEHVLQRSIFNALLQAGRIKNGLIKSQPQDDSQDVLFADIQFFLVSITNTLDALTGLRSLLKRDVELKELYRKYLKRLQYLDNFRDHEIHIIDGRLRGKGKRFPLKDPRMLGVLEGTDYNFGGERFNLIETFSMIQDLKLDVNNWSCKRRHLTRTNYAVNGT